MISGNKIKNILITGGSRGIGAEAVKEFTARNAAVAFFYNQSYTESVKLSKETGALNIKCNVSNAKSVDAAMCVANEFFDNDIDLLICNAGISDMGLLTDIGDKRWHDVINTNLNGVYYCVRSVLPEMISKKNGNIIIISSMWGQVGAACEVAYSTAKAGLIGFTKALAKEVGPSGIRVNCLAPGMIDTSMNSDIDEDVVSDLIYETPLMRIGKTEDIVNAMEFLSSEKSSFITGQVIGINGGFII